MSHQDHLKEIFLANDGSISFETFMREGLYDPKFGYYSSNIATVGRRGDFSTSATLHSVLGRSMAKWALEEKKASLGLGALSTWHLLEVGAGDGSLASDILSSLGALNRLRLTYHIVEVSPNLRKEQEKKLRGFRVQWHETMESGLAACHGIGLVISNELIDAFPTVVVRWSGTEWEELFLLDQGDAGIHEEFRSLDPERKRHLNSSALGTWEDSEIPLRTGQRCEIQMCEDWLKQWLPSWKRGSMLTIDYGDYFPKLYHRKPEGTIRGYYQGVRLQKEELYHRFGHQDLTADVNFTDLQSWTESHGLETIEILNQREFFKSRIPGIDASGNLQQDSALEFVMSPYGAGDAFKVILQRKANSKSH